MPQIIVNGVLLGGLYALIAIGFSLVWGVMNVVNIASASFVILGSYVSWVVFHRLGLDPFLAIPVAFVLLAIVGYLLQRLLINRVIRHGLVMTMIITFGLDLIVQNLTLELFTADYRSVAPSYAGAGFHLFGAVVPYIRLATFGTAVLISLLLWLFLTRTREGMAIRATTLNLEAAELMGVTVERVYALTYAIAAGLAGVAGVLVSMVYNFNPTLGTRFLPSMFVVTVLGGLGSIPGAIAGGVLLGVIEAVSVPLFGASSSKLIPYLLLVVFLVVRPQGLLGNRFYGGSKA